MKSLLRLLATNLAPLTLLAAVLAFIWPPLFSPFAAVFKELFAATMFALGVVLNREDLQQTLSHPLRILLGVLTQFVVMPLLAFSLVSLFGLPPYLALGFIIVGSAPGAMASNVIVYLAGGALAFSIALTTVATFLSPLLSPALIDLFAGEIIAINPAQLMWTILYILVIPLSGGMIARYYLDGTRNQSRFMLIHGLAATMGLFVLYRYAGLETWQVGLAALFLLVIPLFAKLSPRQLASANLYWSKEIAPALAAVAIVVICAYAVARNKTAILDVGWQVLLLVILLNALGYLAGWYLARLYRFDHSHRVTLSIEIGMQNAGMGVALALAHFQSHPEVALPGALFAVWSVITAAGASAWFRRQQQRQG